MHTMAKVPRVVSSSTSRSSVIVIVSINRELCKSGILEQANNRSNYKTQETYL